MIVKCLKIIDIDGNKTHKNSNDCLTVGKKYIVLGIEISPNCIEYTLVGDNADKQPGLYDAQQFSVINGTIPKNWCVEKGDLSHLLIYPKAWQKPGFWEDCYDGDPKALEIYKREAQIIYEEEACGVNS